MAWSPDVETHSNRWMTVECSVPISSVHNAGEHQPVTIDLLDDAQNTEANVVKSGLSCRVAKDRRSLRSTFRSSQRWHCKTVYRRAFLGSEMSYNTPTTHEQTSSMHDQGALVLNVRESSNCGVLLQPGCRAAGPFPTRLMHQPQSSPHLCIPTHCSITTGLSHDQGSHLTLQVNSHT